MRSQPASRLPRLLDAWTLILVGILTATAPAWANDATAGPMPGPAFGGR